MGYTDFVWLCVKMSEIYFLDEVQKCQKMDQKSVQMSEIVLELKCPVTFFLYSVLLLQESDN